MNKEDRRCAGSTWLYGLVSFVFESSSYGFTHQRFLHHDAEVVVHGMVPAGLVRLPIEIIPAPSPAATCALSTVAGRTDVCRTVGRAGRGAAAAHTYMPPVGKHPHSARPEEEKLLGSVHILLASGSSKRAACAPARGNAPLCLSLFAPGEVGARTRRPCRPWPRTSCLAAAPPAPSRLSIARRWVAGR